MLRDYQTQGIANLFTEWQSGHQRVCFVLPTGGGKTVIGQDLIMRERAAGGKCLFLVHRRELIKQTARRFRDTFGQLQVGTVGGGLDPSPYAPIQVATIQTCVARQHWPDASLVIIDECHHYMADEYRVVADRYPQSRVVGLTATPERSDGKPLGDLFTGIVTGAKYSQLLRDGFLVPCKVYQPPEALGSDLACDPLQAWQRYSEGSPGFAFCGSVKAAGELAERMNEVGIPAALIEAKTPKRERDQSLTRFAAGELKVLTNVAVLTEGVDVPQARVVMLASNCDHVGGYLQKVGRVLRPHSSKRDAILIDLTGSTLIHGMPTEDREYSLDGKGIKRTSVAPLKNCLKCGATILSAFPKCPECGFEFTPAAEARPPTIFDMELRAVYAGADTPVEAQQRELNRLLELCDTRGWSVYFAVKEFKKLFGREPQDELQRLPLDRKRELFDQMKAAGMKKGWPINRVRGWYKATTGQWPEWGWR